MGEYLPSSLFSTFMDRDGVEVRKLGEKKISTHLTEKAWSIKNLFFGFREKVSRETRWEVPSGQDSFILLLGWPIKARDLVHFARSRC